jgi:hypothetical protein
MGNKVSGRPEDSFPFLPVVEEDRKACHQTPNDAFNAHDSADRLTWLESVVLSRSQSGASLSCDLKRRRPRDRSSVIRTSVVYEPVIEEKPDGDDSDDSREGQLAC